MTAMLKSARMDFDTTWREARVDLEVEDLGDSVAHRGRSAHTRYLSHQRAREVYSAASECMEQQVVLDDAALFELILGLPGNALAKALGKEKAAT